MSGIVFGTGGWRAVIGDGFTRDNIRRVAKALALRMKEEGCADKGICIGYDRRFLSRESAIWFSEVMAWENVPVSFINLAAPTPQIMFTVLRMGFPYGAAVTASHNPAIYNGIKLFTRGGRDAVPEVTDEIAARANSFAEDEVQSMDFDEARACSRIRYIDPRDEYLDSILGSIDLKAIRARRPRIALDPMYGVSLSGLLTILYTARCDVNIINEQHDAFFGRHLPAPNEETLRSLENEVRERNADMGVATDGDADRIGIVDENSRYISANEILVLLYHYLLRYKGWRGCAVRNTATTHILDRVAEKFGEKCYEVPVGFKHISQAMDEHDALIGGESSGGLTVRGHIRGKDGLYAAALIVEMLCVTGKSISQLVREIYDEYGEAHMAEYDWPLTQQRKDEIDEIVMKNVRLPEFSCGIESVSTTDGCKVRFEDGGWIIVRFSGTEPRVRIFAEKRTVREARDTVRTMASFLGLPFPEE